MTGARPSTIARSPDDMPRGGPELVAARRIAGLALVGWSTLYLVNQLSFGGYVPLRSAEVATALATLVAATGVVTMFAERGLLSVPVLTAGAIVLFVTLPCLASPTYSFYERSAAGVLDGGILTNVFLLAFALGYLPRPAVRAPVIFGRRALGGTGADLWTYRLAFAGLALVAFGWEYVYGIVAYGGPFGRLLHLRGAPLLGIDASAGALPGLPRNLYFPMVVLGFWYVRRFAVSWLERALVYLAVLTAIVGHVIVGERHLALGMLLAVVYLHGSRALRGPIRLRTIVPTLTLALVLYYLTVFIGAVRNIKSMSAFLTAGSDLRLLFAPFRYDTFEALMLVRERIGQIGPMWGYSFFSLLVFPIPRMLWSGKPVGFGKVINQWVLGGGTTQGQSFAPMVYTELYASAGFLLMIVLVVGIALLARSAAAELPKSEMGFLVWVLILSDIPNLVRGDILSMTGYLIVRVFGLLVFVHGVLAARAALARVSARAAEGTAPL